MNSTPQPTLGLKEAVAIIVGIVIGAGIFKAPSLVAMFAGSEFWMYAAWIAGGVISLIGALCYAELATAYPNAGGDYHFLHRAYGRAVSFLFAWARFSVITTGSIALLAFVFGDYMTEIAPLHGNSTLSAALYGAAAVMILTWINVRGIRAGALTQSWLTVAEVGGLVVIIGAAVWLAASGAPVPASAAPAPAAAAAIPPLSMLGLAMVFVLLTYGGWNEAAYISAEVRDPHRNMLRAMVISIVLITALYLLVNWAYVSVLGIGAMGKSKAVAADLLQVAFGSTGQIVISIMVAIAALTSINATMIVGARTNYALGRDWPVLSFMGTWNAERNAPVTAMWVQGAMALVLVLLALLTSGQGGGGFKAMVEFTSPVFWLFFLLSGCALIVLRVREPNTPRPFKVPLYPVLPVLFIATCGYMLWSSLSYVYSKQLGGLNAAWIGVGVLAVGVVLLVLVWRQGGAPGAGPQTRAAE
ncbi:APC family permease [Piscinibacterium candidicorallinum]|uniref:APC family permease n=1 Tax=Piscinibacterium candidicorallinum TaxID=1793872 RepID=A0ABV7H950_9BURK